LLQDIDLADIHGQDRFNFRHAAISREDSKEFLDSAFQRDFERNGPSLFRLCRTTFQGWKRYKNYPDLRVRERFHRETRMLRHAYPAVLWAMEHRLKSADRSVVARIRALRKEIEREFGFVAAAASRILGPVLWWTSLQEDKRLARGIRHDPPTIVERRNWEEAGSATPRSHESGGGEYLGAVAGSAPESGRAAESRPEAVSAR
jgi:hypothetical protein